jgi:hypothetical protein
MDRVPRLRSFHRWIAACAATLCIEGVALAQPATPAGETGCASSGSYSVPEAAAEAPTPEASTPDVPGVDGE